MSTAIRECEVSAEGWCGDATSVVEFLRPLRDQLDAPGVLEVCVNRPGELLVETVRGWQTVPAPELTQERCLSLATAVATFSDQQISQERPLLSATLPSGERIQFVIPPAVTRGTVSITVRKPSHLIKGLDDFEREGLFERTATVTSADDFRLEDLRRRRMSIYVRIPPNRLANARPLLNLFFSQLVSLNTQQLPEQDTSLKVQCLLVNDEFAAMGRVGIISSAAAFLAGYNLRLLTVVQAMSQLDAVYGDKDARTFATNHGLQILYAPREQRDADEYSAMLGHFTERATSRGRSRSFSEHSHSSVSRNESEQRRALLLPQEFKELGAERLVVIFENCKPILGEKIRYHRDKVFKARLRPPPVVPQIDMDLHFARVQQRWRYADDELPAGEGFDIEQLAQDFSDLPVPNASSIEADIKACVDGFFLKTASPSPAASAGGTIEPVGIEPADAEHDAPAPERALQA